MTAANMSKSFEYQQFANKLRDSSDRPSLLLPLFEQALTIAQAKEQLQQLARNQIRMFKAPGARREAPKRVERIMTAAGARRRVGEAALKQLGQLRNIRMTRDCRDWIDSMVAQLRKDLCKGA